MAKNLTTGLQRGLRQSIAGGLGTGDLFSTASLDLQFARHKSLDSRVTHTRQSSATYVDGDGVIRTAVTNLLLRSEEFDNAIWVAANGASKGSANAGTAPNGTTTADSITIANQADSTLYYNSIFSAGTYTLSVYVKVASGTSAFRISAFQTNGVTVASSNLTATTEWQRFSFTFTAATTVYARVLTASSSFTGGTFLIWGAQLEESSTVGQYVKTTTAKNGAPRFDHDPTTGESLGLLVEESRTNLLLYSACNSNWTTAGFGTATYDLGLSALGIFSGVSVGSLGQVWHTLYRTGISLTASTVYAFTLFYRAGTSGRCRLVFRNNATATETIINGVAGNLSVNGAFAGAATVLAQYLCSDGLTYVVTGTFTPNGTSADHWFRIGPDSGTSGQTVIALGGQLETGSFPTSYIPTEGLQVTRAADVASITGTNFSSWYEQSEGTSYCQVVQAPQFVAFQAMATFTGTTTADEWRLWRTNTTVAQCLAVVNNSSTLSTSITYSPSSSGRYTFAGTIKANDAICAANGTLSVADTSGQVPTLSSLRIGARNNNAFYWNGHISRLTYWPTRLSNDTLQTITT